jgi:flagellar biosynthesis protein FlhF
MQRAQVMKIKSYFADSVEQAIQEARQELGTEAMLITSRRSAPENRGLGAYEVVFGLQSTTQRPRPAAPSPDLSNELQSLRDQLQEIKSTLQASRGTDSGSPEADDLVAELVSADLARNIAQEIVSAAGRLRDQLSREQPSACLPLRSYAAEIAANRLQFAAPFAKPLDEAPRVVVFAGPPGAGKTSTLVKIAIRECLAQRQPVRVLSVDPSRVAAHEKLRSFAAIIGVAFTAANSVPELLAALGDARGKSVVLVDTPGSSPAEMAGANEIASCLTKFSNRQTHLVLPAPTKRADLMRAIRNYAAFEADYLLFTKLDETVSQGAILSAALEAAKPISFFANGQNIPEDIEPAHARALLGPVFRPEVAEAMPAA